MCIPSERREDQAMNVTYNDVWLKRDDGPAPPQGCELVASIQYVVDTKHSYEIFLIDECQSEWRVWTAICNTREACESCLGLYLNHSPNWQQNCLKAGLLIAAQKELNIKDAAVFLLLSILRLRAGGQFMAPIKCGLLSEAELRSAEEEVQKERENIRSLAKTVGKNSRMIRLARKLHLSPAPSGDDVYSWYARCPWPPHEGWHKLSISTKTKRFFCVNCHGAGNTKELEKFYEDAIKATFSPLVALIEGQVGSVEKVKTILVTVSWYNDLISPTLKLQRAEFKKIIKGIPFHKKGSGFSSEEGPKHDDWSFNLEFPGSLEVDYDDDAQGFIGSFEDASIEVK
jgi:hypothetical protein